jgi:2-polyprenyl-3-methyl-5-hydroxy-6-metoxy-1,4-benzoquinol methylase
VAIYDEDSIDANTSQLFASQATSESVRQTYLNSLGQVYENVVLGENTSRIFNEDPKLLLFTLSRYKFVSKMLRGSSDVLEIGCQEGFGAQLVAREVNHYLGVDFYLPYIEHASKRAKVKNMDFSSHDILEGRILNSRRASGKFDAIFSLDVIEHIDPQDERAFLENSVSSLEEGGVMITGTPSLESQAYASTASKVGHINCKSAPELQALLKKYFKHVFIFSLNDEVMHTGFWPMSHYIMALACEPKM